MPYTKPRPTPWVTVTRLLRGYGINATSLADILDCSRPTATRRLQEPGTLTLDELHRISTRAHIPIDEIREAIKR